MDATHDPQDATQKSHLKKITHQRADLWHTPDGRTFATVMVRAAKRSFSLQSAGFERWLRHAYFMDQGEAPSSQALRDAIDQADASARFLGEEREAFVRVGEKNGRLYLDLANDHGQVVEITADEWRVVINPDIRFIQPAGMLPLPVPVPGGSVRELRTFINLPDEDAFVLAVSYLVAALRPRGPFPIAFLQGEQGSAKTTTGRVIRRLIDPVEPLDKTKPKSEQDLFIDADQNWILLFDNLSGVSDWLADAFCRIATGGGFATRKLYTGRDQETFSVSRPQILNGIDDLAIRDDLRDRGLLFVLPVIASDHRLSEKALERDFAPAHPRILGALLDAVSAALRGQDSVHLPQKPRMADFAVWATAAEAALPWDEGTFIKAYERNRREALLITLEHESLARALERLMDKTEGSWSGTPTELYGRLFSGPPRVDWSLPKSASEMSKRLRRLIPALREVGIEVTYSRHSDKNRTRQVAVRRVHAVRDQP